MPVSIRLLPSAFTTGGLLDGQPIHKTRYIMQSGVESAPHIAHGAWFKNRDPGDPQPPNSISIVLQGTSPSWFDTPTEFNMLPYSEIRAQIANEIERGVMEVINSGGSIASADDVRNGAIT